MSFDVPSPLPKRRLQDTSRNWGLLALLGAGCLFLIWAAIAIFGGSSEEKSAEDEPRKPTTRPDNGTIPAREEMIEGGPMQSFVEEFEANTARALAKYKGKRTVVAGWVFSVEKDSAILTAGPNQFVGANVKFRSTKDLHAISQGEIIGIHGVVVDKPFYIEMKDCVLVGTRKPR